MCFPSFGPFWSVKYINFGQKLPIRSAHHTFLESRYSEVNKNPYYILSPKGSQTKVISLWNNTGRPRKEMYGNTKIL